MQDVVSISFIPLNATQNSQALIRYTKMYFSSKAWYTLVVWTLVWLSVLMTSNQCQSSSPVFTLPASLSRPPNLQVDSIGQAFVAAGNQLFRLDRDLVSQESVVLASDAVSLSLSSGGSWLVVCLTDLSCAVYNTTGFSSGQIFNRPGAFSSENVVVFANGDSFYTGSIFSDGNDGNGVQDEIALRQYGFGGTEFVRSFNYDISTLEFIRNFYSTGGVQRGSNAYYFIVDTEPFIREVRVMRVCHVTDCPGGTSPCDFTALYELQLTCTVRSIGSTERLCGVSVVDDFGGTSGPSVVLSRCLTGSTSRNLICSFSLDDIDRQMNMKYSQCSQGIGRIEVAWNAGSRTLCGDFQASDPDVCNFSPPLDDFGVDERPMVDGRQLVNIGAATSNTRGGTTITASVAVKRDSFSFLFVGYTDRDGNHFVGGFFITNGTTDLELNVDDAFGVKSMPSPIAELRCENGLDYVYAVTESTDSTAGIVTLIPIEECSSFTDCSSCLLNGNPLCGWCIVENKCSRREVCQNVDVPGTTRYIQGATDQCVNATITPNQFVLDRPEILSVSVSPGLPVTLPNEEYQCHVSNSELRRTIIVPAVEVTNNTAYTCNITEEVPEFSGVQSVWDFRFQSTLINIPFDTSGTTLNFYRCDRASSCTECLQTDNACGWCIHNRVCSGTAMPCRDDTNTNNYLQLGVGESVEDVCPLLEQSPSGEYIHPVRVDRNIELVTRNLPPVIDGFSYSCLVDGMSLTAVYNSSSSLICQVDSDQLTQDGSDGVEIVDIAIMWSGPGVVNSRIDESNSVNLTLYECSELADDCSSCIASNLNRGFECGYCDQPNGMTDGCSIADDCTATLAVLISSGLECPAPSISSFTPTSGPLQGGTAITITGTELGVNISDFQSDSIMVGSTPCEPIPAGYIPGRQVRCVTDTFSMTANNSIIITLNRMGGLSMSPPSATEFEVSQPAVTAIDPTFGPMAGGTAVTLRGRDLSIGNIENTRITVDGRDCTIAQTADITPGEITCTNMAYSGDIPYDASVVVHIDDADVSNPDVQFMYLNDPNFTGVSPNTIIPAGGINLTFIGTNMSVVQTPILRITDPAHTSGSPYPESSCMVVNDSAISCLSPPLTSNPLTTNSDGIMYTVVVDAAPGPDSTVIPLNVKPNPTNFTLVTQQFQIGADTQFVQINGISFASVELNEISVTVGGEPCVIVGTPNDEDGLLCIPPTSPPGGDNMADVVISIGANVMMVVGTLTYGEQPTVTTDLPIEIIIPVVVVALALIVAVMLCILCIVCCVYRSNIRKREQKWKESHANTGVALLPRKESVLSDMVKELVQDLPQHLVISSNQIRVLNQAIGQGEFGIVYKAHLVEWHGITHKTVALKTLKGLFTPSDVQSMMAEIMKMKDFQHPNVMSLIGVCLDAGPGTSIVMPYMANGSLLNYLKKERENLDLSDDEEIETIVPVKKLLLRMCLQISLGMEYLAQQMFIHRDLAARNCMLDGAGNVKVADFGLSENIYTRGYFRQNKKDAVRLPVKWMAPESLRDGIFSEKTDVWAFGVTCWEVMSTGRLPYPAVDPIDMLKLLEKGVRLEKPTNSACAPEIYSVMKKCWQPKPEGRPSFQQLASTLDKLLQSVAGYMEMSMVLPGGGGDDGDESVVFTNEATKQEHTKL